ncbi:hypothetical protein MN116_007259 [Schistosoma mekongi]|uniref:DNA replication complex GINS protein PSF1 n=1 Tax=Schistosoma mekongi TaxID=38744 RepID=A0AAE2D398_SCHME|nr:hypothetical protein MN116_007259 [Schistosoma mekongi]
MLAQTSLQLVKELKRSQQGKLPPYSEDKIRVCLEEMRVLYDANHRDVALVSNSSSDASLLSETEDHSHKIQSVLVRHAVLERNKRCLLAYHYARLMRIKELRWEYGIILPKDVRDNLSQSEQTWFKHYCSCLANFMQADTPDRGGGGMLDLIQYRTPPKSLFLEVRCLQNFGEFETEDGSVLQLTKGSHHLMYRTDCEALIRQGILEHITE